MNIQVGNGIKERQKLEEVEDRLGNVKLSLLPSAFKDKCKAGIIIA